LPPEGMEVFDDRFWEDFMLGGSFFWTQYALENQLNQCDWIEKADQIKASMTSVLA
jgi:hypothetical protein